VISPSESRLLRGKDIVCVSSLDWGAMWTSKQQIMHRLAGPNRILYVEEPVTMLAPLKVPHRWKRWGAIVPRLSSPEPGLWVLTPPPLLPFGNMSPTINRINQRVLARYIRGATKRLHFAENAMLWIYVPASVALVTLLARGRGRAAGKGAPRGGPVVYHCVDEHSAFPGFLSPEVVRRYDDELTRRADLVVTTAENLRRPRLALNPHTYTVPNAADVEIFNRALDPTLAVPSDLAAIPAPRLAAVGLHDSRLDIDALEALAEADPSWQVVLIGPVKAGQVDTARLRRHPNIHLLGEKPRQEVPGYLKGAAVALIPYILNDLTRNIFPLKLYEYLAAGLPVVAAALPELAPFAGMISLARESGEYPALVREALADDSPKARAARVAFASGETWEARVQRISMLVEEMLARIEVTGNGAGAASEYPGAAPGQGV
jgi:glycosyltransferase involved in cell wall biosynthesis